MLVVLRLLTVFSVCLFLDNVGQVIVCPITDFEIRFGRCYVHGFHDVLLLVFGWVLDRLDLILEIEIDAEWLKLRQLLLHHKIVDFRCIHHQGVNLTPKLRLLHHLSFFHVPTRVTNLVQFLIMRLNLAECAFRTVNIMRLFECIKWVSLQLIIVIRSIILLFYCF